MNGLKKILSVALLMLNITAYGGLKPGGVAKEIALKNIDGKYAGTKNHPQAKGFIVVFTCNHCPFAKLYQQRMNELEQHYSPLGYEVLAISSNDADAVPEDNYAAMQARAKEQHYQFPYLYDETQEVARAFGAVKTPHAFVLERVGDKLIVRYSGAIDDNGAEPDQVKHAFVADAVDALLQHKEVPVAETKSVGCALKWKP